MSSPGDQESGVTLTTWHRDLFAAIGRWPWLRELNDQVTEVVAPLYDRYRDTLAVELMHGGRWAGHALHPALSDLPIGFWSATVVLDALGKDGGGDGESGMDAASTLTAAGLVSAAATAVTGVVDWNVSDDEDRRVGLFHGVLNLGAMVLQGASLAARMSGHRATARTFGVAGMAAVTAAGFVGGHLVQGRAAMVNRVATSTGPTRWVKAVEDSALADGVPAAVEVDGRKVFLYRGNGAVHALDNVCSHAGGLLSRGEIDGCVVTCPLHGARFDLRTGQVARGPAHTAQPVLPTRVRNGWIEVRGSQPRSRRSKG